MEDRDQNKSVRGSARAPTERTAAGGVPVNPGGGLYGQEMTPPCRLRRAGVLGSVGLDGTARVAGLLGASKFVGTKVQF